MTAPLDLQPPFSRDDVEVVTQKTVYDGFFSMAQYTLRHRLFAGGFSQPITREVFVRGEAVAAILYDPLRHQVGLVEQFRIGALNEPSGPWCLEVVAGMLEAGESPVDVALREIKEETSLDATRLDYICNYLSSPGGTTEKLHVYCALLDLSEAGGIHGLADESEDIRVRVLAADDVFDAMLKGRFNNAATLISLQWLQANYRRLQAELQTGTATETL